jgi:hypothetical protein
MERSAPTGEASLDRAEFDGAQAGECTPAHQPLLSRTPPRAQAVLFA